MRYKVKYHRSTMVVKGKVKDIPEFEVEYENKDEMTSYERSVFDIMEVYDEVVWESRLATFTYTPEEQDDADPA